MRRLVEVAGRARLRRWKRVRPAGTFRLSMPAVLDGIRTGAGAGARTHDATIDPVAGGPDHPWPRLALGADARPGRPDQGRGEVGGEGQGQGPGEGTGEGQGRRGRE